MKILIETLLILFCFPMLTNAQVNDILHGYSKENCTISTFKPRKGTNPTLIRSIGKNEVVISFKERFSDSLVVYVNNKFHSRNYVQSDSVILGMSNFAFKIKTTKNINKILLILPQKKVYTSIAFDRQYKMLKVFRIGRSWEVVKTNYVPEYQ